MPAAPATTSAFNLPTRLAHKSAPALIATDEHHFAAITASLDAATRDLTERLDTARRAPARSGTAALERDQEIHRLTARLHTLHRYGPSLCLGRMVPTDHSAPRYIGRLGLTDAAGHRLLIDWRSPAAEPFFAATTAHPMGLASRRRFRWTGGRITDYWDETFDAAALTDTGTDQRAALDDQSAFIASLAAARTPHMRDVLATIATDQDAIIRAASHGTLVVDGGPGTGKTVVALHRAAYLLYADPHIGQRHHHAHGGVLVVGPHHPYLAYVADVLPSLGEEGVATCTLADLVPEGTTATPEPDPHIADLKASAAMVAAVADAVAFYEQPPTTPTTIETPWADITVRPTDWADAFDTVEKGTAHNEARDDIHTALVDILTDALTDALELDPDDEHTDTTDEITRIRRSLATNPDLRRALHRAWPILQPTDIIADLWTVPAYLHHCAPHLTPDQVTALQRRDPYAWTTADLPLLDAARRRLGDPDTEHRHRQAQATIAADRARMKDVIDDLITTDDSELHIMSMLRGDDLQSALVDTAALPATPRDTLAGPFAHIIVDEAQELTDAQWQMLLARCPTRSFTIVGDRAQARNGFTETWEQRLTHAGLDHIHHATLTINYRTPREVMAEAEPLIRAALPDANIPVSIRDGAPVHHATTTELARILDHWLTHHDEGTACVITRTPIDTPTPDPEPKNPATPERVLTLTPETAKGLEFDLVILIDPHTWGEGITGAVDRYVAMTRATGQLTILTSP